MQDQIGLAPDSLADLPVLKANELPDLLRQSREVLIVLDSDFRIVWHNPAARSVLEWSETEHFGDKLLDVVHPDDRDRIGRLLELAEASCQATYRINCYTGGHRSLEAHISSFGADHLLLSHRDPTAVEEAAQMRHQATHDQLTGLPTRSPYVEALTHGLARVARSKKYVAALFLDLDGFKAVNDGLGHEAGDELLIQVGERLSGCLRTTDMVARFGGDEFVVFAEDLSNSGDAEIVATNLINALETPFTLSQGEANISASIGVAVSADADLAAEDLMRDADAAMYHVKAHGKNGYKLYDDLLRAVAADRKDLESALRTALTEGQFRTYYQPIVEMLTGEVHSFDVSTRWDHPLRGELSIGEWVTLAEEVGLIVDIDRWVLRSACQQAAEWQDQYTEHEDLVVWVEVSTRQLLRKDFVDTVADVLASVDGRRGSLGIALRERSLAKHPQQAKQVLSSLATLGVRLELEEFSGGCFSPSQLQELPFDTVKLDRTLTEELGDPRARRALAGIIALCRNLDLDVVAKGLDDATHLTTMLQIQCDSGLGTLFAPSLPAEQAGEVLVRGHRWNFHRDWGIVVATATEEQGKAPPETFNASDRASSIAGLGSPAVRP
jgi:diguanylate cyclase (GGDEF)-like protein/PAS domain S-box-containing protein